MSEFNPENVPQSLHERPQWVCWQEKTRNGKLTKIPKDPDGSGANAKSNDLTTWSTFDHAVETARSNEWGIGFMFADAGPYVGVDLDHCLDADGELAEWLPDIEGFLGETYIERSPSGDGLHIILRDARIPDWWTNQENDDGGVEVYDSGRFFTFTGDVIDRSTPTVNEIGASLSEWLETAWDVFNDEPPGESGDGDVRGPRPGSTADTGDVGVYDVILRASYPEEERVEHPVHGSDTGSNFAVDEGGETWVCWRGTCDPTGEGDATVGNALHLIGMQENIISCGDWAGTGLSSETWREIFDAARDRGFDIPSKEVADKPDDDSIPSSERDDDDGPAGVDPVKLLDAHDVHEWSPSSILGTTTTVRGQVAKRGARKIRHETVGYRCTGCGNVERISQNGPKLRTPSGECDLCGSENYIRDDDKTSLQDYQRIRLQKLPEKSGTSTNTGINIDLLNKHVGTVSPGDRIVVDAGIDLVDEDKRVSELYGTAKGIHAFDRDIEDIDIEPHRERIEEIAENDETDALDVLSNSLAPDHYGDLTIKQALVLQMFGGVTDHSGTSSKRGTIHVALIGEPSCHAAGTELLRHDGSLVAVENIESGDVLMGPDSEPRTVETTDSGREQMYRINPYRGESFVVNENHILTLVKSGPGGRNEDGDIVDITVSDYLDWPKTPQKDHKLLRTGVDFSNDPDLPVDPYFLGVLIGDGYLVGTPRIASGEPELVDQFGALADSFGVNVVEHSGRDSAFSFVNVDGKGKGNVNPLSEQLAEFGLNVRSAEKHLPDIYKTASENDRLELLAGLLDTDGYLQRSKKGYEYTTASVELAENVAFVARSLGFGATITEKKAQLDGWDSPRTYHRLQIYGDCDTIPCRITRKQAIPRSDENDNVLRCGFTVDPIGTGTYHGFSLEEEPHYVMGDFTIAHNTGKSTLMDRVATILPRTIKTTGQGSTSAGLTATAVQSEFAGSGDTAGWTLEAGALVKADGGTAAVDELDKMDAGDRNGLLQAMSDQEITVAKAGLNTTLPANTTVLAAANPKYGRFEPTEELIEQFDLSPVLLSRFDLVFTLADRPDAGRDRELVTTMLGTAENGTAAEIDDDTFRAYVALGREYEPELTDDAAEIIADDFVELREKGGEATRSTTTRSVGAIRRLAEASARIHLREKVTVGDVQRATSIHRGYLAAIGALKFPDDATGGEPEMDADNPLLTGKLSVDDSPDVSTQHARRKHIKEVIDELCDAENGTEHAPREDVIQRVVDAGAGRSQISHDIRKQLQNGVISEPVSEQYRTT